MTTEQLKPCHRCGCPAGPGQEFYGDEVFPDYKTACCHNIDCPEAFIECEVAVWNTRPIEDDLRAKLAIAVEALERIKSTPEYDSAYTCDFAGEALTKIHDQKQS